MGLALLATSAVGVSGVVFVKPGLLSQFAMVAGAEVISEGKPPTHQKAEQQTELPMPHEGRDSISNNELGLADGTPRGGEHDATRKNGPEQQVELAAAPDFVVPVSRSSLVVQAMRKISKLQSEMAMGHKNAPQALKTEMLRVPKLIAEMEVSKLTSSEIQSAALFVLSGGDPSVVARFLQAASMSVEQRALLEGVANYATADFSKASERLLPLNPNQFETTLNAQLTIAQVQLTAPANSPNIINRLAFAANIVPGTLIEEAAIRRIIPHLSRKGEVNSLLYWTQRYLRRFPNSLYYRDFEVSFVDAIVSMANDKLEWDETSLASTFRAAGENRTARLAREILLRVIQSGNTAGCVLVAKALDKSFGSGSDKFSESEVLIEICRVTELDEKNLADLKLIDPSKLDEAVKQNLVKAIAMAETIQLDEPLLEDNGIGPHLPLAADEAFAALFASVAQQMDASIAAIKKVDKDEAGSGK